MRNKPVVSVIMIFLDAEVFVREAIESVLAQTYPHWELLLVDDGSTDGSTDIALQYAAQYPEKIVYLDHEGHQNKGMSASRNVGIRAAKGEYIAFLDADDVYLAQKFERQVAILEERPSAAMVYGATQHWYSWTGSPEDRTRDRLRKLGVPPDTLVQPPTLIPLFLQHKAWTPGTCGVLVRREAVTEVGGFDERFRGMFEDQVFFYKLCLTVPVFVERGSWDRYRQHPSSHTRTSAKAKRFAFGRRPSPTHHAFLQWLESYLIEQGIRDEMVWQVLQREMWPYRHPHWHSVLMIRQRLRRVPRNMKVRGIALLQKLADPSRRKG